MQWMWFKHRARKKWGPLLEQARLEALWRQEVEEQQRGRLVEQAEEGEALRGVERAARQQRALQDMLVGGVVGG